MPRNEQDMGQPGTRRPGKFTDNHGRRWFSEVDKRSGGTIGRMTPIGWRAPWMPEQTFFRFDAEDPTRFVIDYQGMLDSRLAAHEAWNADFRSAALKRGWNPEDEEKMNSLLELVGPKPQPIEPIVAAMQGNSWILGLTQKPDARLEPFMVKRVSRVAKAVESLNFRDQPIEPIDQYADYEEDADPQALGGKLEKLPAKPRKTKAVA